MIKLTLLALFALSILGLIVFFIFSSSKTGTKPQIPFISSPKPSISSLLSDIRIDPVKIKAAVEPILVNLYAQKQKAASGYVRFSPVAGKILIQLKSDSISDQIGLIYSGSCASSGKIVYPLASLKDGKSQTVWQTDMAAIKASLPLSVKVFKEAKNLNTYTRCADIKV